jgi:hypothetical protein
LTPGEVLQGAIAEIGGRNEKPNQQPKQREHGV